MTEAREETDMHRVIERARAEERNIIADHFSNEAAICREMSRETKGEVSWRYLLIADEMDRQARAIRK